MLKIKRSKHIRITMPNLNSSLSSSSLSTNKYTREIREDQQHESLMPDDLLLFFHQIEEVYSKHRAYSFLAITYGCFSYKRRLWNYLLYAIFVCLVAAMHAMHSFFLHEKSILHFKKKLEWLYCSSMKV